MAPDKTGSDPECHQPQSPHRRSPLIDHVGLLQEHHEHKADSDQVAQKVGQIGTTAVEYGDTLAPVK